MLRILLEPQAKRNVVEGANATDSFVHTDDSNVPTNATHCFMECYSGVSIWAKDVKKGNRVSRVRLFNIQCPVIRDVFLDSGHFATKRAYYTII